MDANLSSLDKYVHTDNCGNLSGRLPAAAGGIENTTTTTTTTTTTKAAWKTIATRPNAAHLKCS